MPPLAWLPDYVAVDIETSGLAAQQDDLLEIAGVKFVAGEPVARFTTTLQSDHALGQRTAKMTGLTQSALAEGLPAAEALRALDAFAGSLPLVAHNVSLDREFLIRFGKELDGVDFTDNQWWDSLELAALVFPELDSLALEHVATALKLEIGQLHRAEADAELAGRVFAALFAHVASAWPAALIAAVRDVELPGHGFASLFQRIPTAIAPDPAPLLAPKFHRVELDPRPALNGEGQELTLVRTRDDASALDQWCATTATEKRAWLVFPPLVYPGQFQGPEKDLRQRCSEHEVPCYPGRQCLLDQWQLALLLAGGVAVSGTLTPFERALLRAWGTTTATGDYSQLSWWVLNNSPTLAQTLPRIAAREPLSTMVDGRVSAALASLAGHHQGVVPWDVWRAPGEPLAPDHGLGVQYAAEHPSVAILHPSYWPLQVLRAGQVSLELSAMLEELGWLDRACREATVPAALQEWWLTFGVTLAPLVYEAEQQVAAFGANPQHPAAIARGDELYWPLVAQTETELNPQGVEAAMTAVSNGYQDALLSLPDVLANCEVAPLLIVALQRLETMRARLALTQAPERAYTTLVQRRQIAKDRYWWSLESFPRWEPDLGNLGAGPVTLYSTALDSEDWRLVERVWGATPASSITYIDHDTPIPAGNTVHRPLLPPGIRSLPAKKIWQGWQISILRRLIQEGEGRWLIVARNPQDVATLQYRLRDPMLRAGWQPLFQRHDGTKGFLMREFGGFEKVVMVGTGEILQELHRFPSPPDTLVILHVPSRPPNDPAGVAFQTQFALSQEAFRDQIYGPLGVLDLKRAFFQWPAFREGEARVYLLDYKQLETPELKALLNHAFPNQCLIDTQPVGRY